MQNDDQSSGPGDGNPGDAAAHPDGSGEVLRLVLRAPPGPLPAGLESGTTVEWVPHPASPEAVLPDGVGPAATDGFDSNTWRTPPELFAALGRLYGPLDVDLFASEFDHLCPHWISKEQDALSLDWAALPGSGVWLNPPYSRGMQEASALRARALADTTQKRAVALLQATMETAWMHDAVFNGADLQSKETIPTGPLRGFVLKLEANLCRIHVHILRGRVYFVHPVTMERSGTGTMGSVAIAFLPKRRLK